MEHLEPKQAHAFLEKNPDAVFIDCRSEMEFMFVGHPVGAMMVPWYDGAEWELNPHFVGQVKKLAGANFQNRPIVLICRSGNAIGNVAASVQDLILWAAWGAPILTRPILVSAAVAITACVERFRPGCRHFGPLTVGGHPRHPSRLSYTWAFAPFEVADYLERFRRAAEQRR